MRSGLLVRLALLVKTEQPLILVLMATGISTTKIAVSMLKAQLGQQERLEQLVKMVLLQKLVIMATGGLVLMILSNQH